jgi:hypothetical protein
MNGRTLFLIGLLAALIATAPLLAQAPPLIPRPITPQQAPPGPPDALSLPIPTGSRSPRPAEGNFTTSIAWLPGQGFSLGGGFSYSNEDSILGIDCLRGIEPLDFPELGFSQTYFETEQFCSRVRMRPGCVGVSNEYYLGHGFAVAADTLVSFAPVGGEAVFSLVWYVYEGVEIRANLDAIKGRFGMSTNTDLQSACYCLLETVYFLSQSLSGQILNW